MHGLEFVLLLLIEVAHLCKNFRVTRDFGYQDIIPLDGLATHANQLVNVRDLVYYLVAVRDDRMKFFKGLEGLVVVAKALINET